MPIKYAGQDWLVRFIAREYDLPEQAALQLLKIPRRDMTPKEAYIVNRARMHLAWRIKVSGQPD